MKPSEPFHLNLPNISSQDDYEVVGHRDGPVVARFPFVKEDPESREAALRNARLLQVAPRIAREHAQMLAMLKRMQPDLMEDISSLIEAVEA